MMRTFVHSNKTKSIWIASHDDKIK